MAGLDRVYSDFYRTSKEISRLFVRNIEKLLKPSYILVWNLLDIIIVPRSSKYHQKPSKNVNFKSLILVDTVVYFSPEEVFTNLYY